MCDCALEVSCDIEGWKLFEYILFCHIIWWISYYCLILVTRQNEEWCCRFLTLVHGCLIPYLAIKDIVEAKAMMDFEPIPLSQEKIHYLSYMLSYFLFDFSWIQFFGNEPWIISVHHIASIMILLNVFWKNYGSHGIAYAAAGLELSNPYLQLRWFLRSYGYLNKPIHTVMEVWFIFLFFIIRVVGGTIMLYYGVTSPCTDIAMKISIISIYGISLVLQWQILLYIRKKIRRKRQSESIPYVTSRVSISAYFQRKTLDRSLSKNFFAGESSQSPNETTEGENAENVETELTGVPETSEPVEATELPETSEPPETSQPSNTSETPKTPKLSDTSGNPKTPKLSDTSGNPKTPKLSDTSGNPKTPKLSDTSGNPKSPKLSDTSGNPKSPKLSDTSGNPKSPKLSDTSGNPRSPKRSDTSEK